MTLSYHDVIKVEAMDEGLALLLFGKKLCGKFVKGDAIELLRALDYLSLAINPTVAYASQRAPRTTIARCYIVFAKQNMHPFSQAWPLPAITGASLSIMLKRMTAAAASAPISTSLPSVSMVKY